MKPIDFPEKYENLMRVAQQALANQQYQQAKELFQRAYELKESFEANSLLVFVFTSWTKRSIEASTLA